MVAVVQLHTGLTEVVDDLVADNGVLVPAGDGLGEFVACDGDAEGAHVVDELAEGVLGTQSFLLVLCVDLDGDGVDVHDYAVF